MDDSRILRKICNEIAEGYSLATYNDEIIYIQHITSKELLQFDYQYQKKLEELIAKGIPSEEEKISILKRDGLWSDKQEKAIDNTRLAIDMFYQNKRNNYVPAEIASYNAQIKESQEHLLNLFVEKSKIIGDTAEARARRKVDTDQIFYSFYKDPDLKEHLIRKEDMDELPEEDMNKLFGIYDVFVQDLGDNNLRKVSLLQDFQYSFATAENLYHFYGKPISKLTTFQVRLANYGNYFKQILSGDIKPPTELLNDPDKLEDWFHGRANIEKVLNKETEDGKSISLVGISSKEMKYYGVEVEKHDDYAIKAALANGGEIGINELAHKRLGL